MGRKRRRGRSSPNVARQAVPVENIESIVNPTEFGSAGDFDTLAEKLQMRAAAMLSGVISSSVAKSSPPQITATRIDVPKTPQFKPAPPKPPQSKADVWRDAFRENLELFPAIAKSTMSIRMSGFTIDEVYSNRIVVGRYSDEQGSFRIYACSDNPPSGCSCSKSDGQYACNHCYAFNLHIIDQLRRDSELVRLVNSDDLKKGTIDREQFRFDTTAESLHKLKRFVTLNPSWADVELPPVSIIKRERLAWDLNLLSRPPRMSPAIQPLNKKGDGWNRGKSCSIPSINPTVERTPADKAALNLFRETYTASASNKVCQILLLLAGQTNVYDNGDQFEIVAGNASLNLKEIAEGWRVALLTSAKLTNKPTVIFAQDGVLAVDRISQQIHVTVTTPTQARCMEELCQLPAVSKPEHVELLIQRCQQLQNLVSISMPEQFGQIIENTVKPVMLMRSRPDGFIDYGIRVRDTQGNLLLPGAGMQITSGKNDDQPVQWRRSFANEHALVNKLRREFKLDCAELHGRLTFVEGLDLLEKLETQADEIEVLWDKASEAPIKSLGTISQKNVRVSIQQKRDWFQLSGLCELEGSNIQLNELLDTLGSDTSQNVGGYVRIGDRGWAKITEELKEGLQKLADSVNHERGQMKFDRTAALAMRDLQDHLQIDATRPWQACLDRLATAEALEPEVPKTLQADLRDYQAAGFKWMRRLAEWGVGGILADDMGLGKTVQTLAVLVDRAHLGPTLVIAPTSVGFNWLRETQRFAPHLTTHSYRETDRNEFFQELGPSHIVVCSYGLALRDIDKLKKITWSSLVLDEAQAIKNSQSKTSQAITEIEADWKIALTGTPVENHLGELWSLFRVISPGLFGGWEQFRKRFANPIEKNRDDDRRLALRDRLKPFVLRRTKQEVLRDLPARTESNLIVELNTNERKLYDKYRLSILSQASEIAKLPDIKDQRFRLLALLTRLRQIACHPRLVEDTWKERSTKLEQLRETLTELRDEGHRTLIFSQFVQHLHLIREMMDEEKITYQYLDGSTTPAQRQEQVDKFQNGDATAFLISLKAGGTGLNLTAADYVIHMDPWWNPAVEDQATDRAHRIGQTKPVMVYRLIAKNTVEEEILKLHEDKRDLVAGILDGTHAASSMSTQELIELLTK